MAAQGLAWVGQQDFAIGAVRSVARHLIPASGVYSIENGLLDDDGSIYRRGGSEYLSTVFGSGGLRWVWDGHLAAGQRTVFADASDFGVLAADGVTPVSLGGSGLSAPVRAVVVGGMLFIPGGTIYGGSLLAADYSTGTLSVTNGSAVVTGAGTAFLANVDAGMLLRVAGTGRYYVVASVDNDSQVTLADAYEGSTAAGQAYALTRLGSAASPYRQADIYATVAERLVTVEGARVYFSGARSELGVLQTHVFAATDYHELPEGARGLGAEAIRDLLIVFATDGIWTVSNTSFDLTDAAGNVQQAMQSTSQDVVLWGPAGVAQYRGALVVPAVDGVYLVDGVSQPLSVSDSITPLLVEHVRAGRKPGGATVFKGHYFLPVLDSSNLVVDLLVCRLDRPVKTRGRTFFPWSWFTGHAGDVAALTARVSATDVRRPQLLGAGRSDGRVAKLTRVFDVEGRPSDADGVAHRWLVESRDFATGQGNVNTVRRARLRYELVEGSAGAVSDIGNLIENPGFEDAEPGVAPPGWSVVPGPPVGSIGGTVVDSWSSKGSQSFRVQASGGGLLLLSQSFAASVGDAIEFGFARRVGAYAPDAECYMRIEFYDAAVSLIATATAGRESLVAGVVDAPQGLVVVPSGAVTCVIDLVFTTVGAGSLEAWVDAVWIARMGGDAGPEIRGFYSVGERSAVGDRWGAFAWGRGHWSDGGLEEFVALEGGAPQDSGRDRHEWLFAAAARYVRLRLESTEAAAKLVLRSAEVAVRTSAKDR